MNGHYIEPFIRYDFVEPKTLIGFTVYSKTSLILKYQAYRLKRLNKSNFFQ